MKKSVVFFLAVLLTVAVSVPIFAGGGQEKAAESTGKGAAVTNEPTGDPNAVDPWILEVRQGLEKYRTKITPDMVDQAGYHLSWDTELVLTNAEVQKLRAGKYKAVYMIDWGSGEWTRANTSGVVDTFKHLGIEVVAMPDAVFDAQRQADQVETVVALKPDVIIFTSVDDSAAAKYTQPIRDAGIPMVLFSNIPKGLEWKKDFWGISSQMYADLGNYGVQLLKENVKPDAKIGVLYLDVPFGTMNIIDGYVMKGIKEQMPAAEVVDREGWLTPEDVTNATHAMITKHPAITGIWATAMSQASFAQQACQTLGRTDIAITCFGADGPSIISMLGEKKNIVGVASDGPYNLGVNHALMAACAILKKEVPPHIVTPAIPITAKNVEEGWELAQREVLPADVRQALQDYQKRNK